MTTWQDLAPELARLQAYYESVRGAVANSNLPTEAYAGINGRLRTAGDIMRRLRADGDLGLAVIARVDGAAAKWVSHANVAGEALQSVLEDVGAEDLVTRFWNEVVLKTAAEAKEVAGKVGEGAFDVLKTLTVLLGLYVVLQVVKVVR